MRASITRRQAAIPAADALTLNAVDTTGDARSRSSASTTASALRLPITSTDIISNVYAVDSSTGGAGAVLDDPSALTYVRTRHTEKVNARRSDQSTRRRRHGRALFSAFPPIKNVLQSADFTVSSTARRGGAHTFRLALYEWNGGNVIGAAIFTTDPAI